MPDKQAGVDDDGITRDGVSECDLSFWSEQAAARHSLDVRAHAADYCVLGGVIRHASECANGVHRGVEVAGVYLPVAPTLVA